MHPTCTYRQDTTTPSTTVERKRVLVYVVPWVVQSESWVLSEEKEGTVLGVDDLCVWSVTVGLFHKSISLCPVDEELPFKDLNVSVSPTKSHPRPVHFQSHLVHGLTLLPDLGAPSFSLWFYPLCSLCKVYRIVIMFIESSLSSLKTNPVLPPTSPRRPLESWYSSPSTKTCLIFRRRLFPLPRRRVCY